jgi:hypothetical protein
LKVLTAAVLVLLFAFGIEILQYFNLVEKLGLQHNKIAKIVMGSSFELIDFVAYTIGVVAIIVVEKRIAKKQLQ